LNDDAKRGAICFYGKGRRAVCHSGPLFSDFKYYSIGFFDTGSAAASIKEDLGRYNATNIEEDKYKFRTRHSET
jgi:cytochrome c peroxidase